MKRILISLFLVLLVFGVYAEEASREDIGKAFNVFTDCLTAALVAEYSGPQTELPCVSITKDSTTDLPLRIAFFLADPSDYAKELSPGFRKKVQNAQFAAVGKILESRNYQMSDYLLSGSVILSFNEGQTPQDIWTALSEKQKTDHLVRLTVSLGIFGFKLEYPLLIEGDFDVSIDEEGFVVFSSDGFSYKY